MKISGYSLNLHSEFSSIFKTSNAAIAIDGMANRVRIKKNIGDTNLDASSTIEKNTTTIERSSKAMLPDGMNTLAEKTTVKTSGAIETSSGTINFSMESSLASAHINIKRNRFKDPLIIGLDGQIADFSDKKMQFDLDADGTKDQIAMLKGNSAYLAMDKNHNGKIDDGTELIGTQNGGFNELQELDSDKNGFIDENDAAYKDLKIWKKTDRSDKVKSLSESKIGALYAEGVNNNYEYISNGNTVGFLSGSSFGISEDGQMLSISQVDLVMEQSAEQTNNTNSEAKPNDAKATKEIIKQSDLDTSNKKEQKTDTTISSLQETQKDSINKQIEMLENQFKKLNEKAQNSPSKDESKEFLTEASVVKGQISVLRASLFKIEAPEPLNTTA